MHKDVYAEGTEITAGCILSFELRIGHRWYGFLQLRNLSKQKLILRGMYVKLVMLSSSLVCDIKLESEVAMTIAER